MQIAEEDSRRRLELVQKDVEMQTDVVNNLEGVWKNVVDEKSKVLKERFQVKHSTRKAFPNVTSLKFLVRFE